MSQIHHRYLRFYEDPAKHTGIRLDSTRYWDVENGSKDIDNATIKLDVPKKLKVGKIRHEKDNDVERLVLDSPVNFNVSMDDEGLD